MRSQKHIKLFFSRCAKQFGSVCFRIPQPHLTQAARRGCSGFPVARNDILGKAENRRAHQPFKANKTTCNIKNHQATLACSECGQLRN